MTRTYVTDEDLPAPLLWAGGGLLVVVVAGLFWAVWKSQFAAPPGYLFDTPTEAIEAGYCLAVAQEYLPAGAPVGSLQDEAAQFWIGRLRRLDVSGMGPAIAAGRGKLGADLRASHGRERAWFDFALDRCTRRAMNYGAHFGSLEN